jgi:hypothetical protein
VIAHLPTMTCIAALLPSCASAATVARSTPAHRSPRISLEHSPPLARFMREMVNVPYSIVLLANHQPARLHRAANVLQDAVEDLAHWEAPPGRTAAANDVFFAYAQSLEHHVGLLQLASRTRDAEMTARSLESIRQTCNQCHRFFRPARKISADVALAQTVSDEGGTQ